ncbi:MAG: phosphonate ABC transporter, permease protein PhnE [Bdellovibrionota bacterium]
MTTQVMEQQTHFFIKQKGIKRKHLYSILLDVFLWSYLFLVLYKIVYQKIILYLRYPDFNWSQPLVALALGVVVAGIFFVIPSFSIGKTVFRLFKGDTGLPWWKKPYAVFSVIMIIMTFVTGMYMTKASLTEFLSPNGLAGAKRIFSSLLTPNWAIFEDALFAAIETIYMALIATALAIPMAFLLSFFAARNLMSHSPVFMIIYSITRFILNMTRAIEPLVWAIIFSVWVGIGPFAGMMALCLHSVASLCKLYSEQIESIDEGPIEAMTATGAHPIQVIWFGVVPQVVLPFLSYTIYRWDINVRMATVIGLVGGGGIGTMLMQYQGLAKWHEVGLLVLVIAVIVWIMDYASAKIREAIK